MSDKKIDLENWVGEGKIESYTIEMDTCSSLFALHARVTEGQGEDHIKWASKLIQLTAGNRVFIFDLEDESPVPIMDVAAVDKLLKPELYVETGLKI